MTELLSLEVRFLTDVSITIAGGDRLLEYGIFLITTTCQRQSTRVCMSANSSYLKSRCADVAGTR